MYGAAPLTITFPDLQRAHSLFHHTFFRDAPASDVYWNLAVQYPGKRHPRQHAREGVPGLPYSADLGKVTIKSLGDDHVAVPVVGNLPLLI